MQTLKKKFEEKGGGVHGRVQTCIRTNDLDLIGDGSHLSSFEMIGNFSFGGIPYHQSWLMWDEILTELGLKPRCTIHVHPDRNDHRQIWKFLGYPCVSDTECKWSDGNVGGYCCEVYIGQLEIGNLVNPMDHSTDVGFGLERLLQVIEGVDRVDETCLFRQDLTPVTRDLYRTLLVLKQNGIVPGGKGRDSVCRRLLRKCYRETKTGLSGLEDWMEREHQRHERMLNKGVYLLGKYPDKSLEWWWDTQGISAEDMEEIKKEL